MSIKKRLARRAILKLISLYQKTISPNHGFLLAGFSRCRFYPSCSQYAAHSIGQSGLIKGGVRSLYRIIRCNPFNPGGVDEPKP